MNVLDIAPGKKWRAWEENGINPGSVIVCVDKTFNNHGCTDLGVIRAMSEDHHVIRKGADIISFLENFTDFKFNTIISERFFEHLDHTQILYLLYLLYTVAEPNATLKIVVPDIQNVVQKYGELDPNSMDVKEFNKLFIECITEVFNEPNDPHKSIWTQSMGRYWIELEDYWEITSIQGGVELDNRSWYTEFNAKRR